jgi:hypothetical protein
LKKFREITHLVAIIIIILNQLNSPKGARTNYGESSHLSRNITTRVLRGVSDGRWWRLKNISHGGEKYFLTLLDFHGRKSKFNCLFLKFQYK